MPVEDEEMVVFFLERELTPLLTDVSVEWLLVLPDRIEHVWIAVEDQNTSQNLFEGG